MLTITFWKDALGRALLTATYSVPGDRAPFITEESHA